MLADTQDARLLVHLAVNYSLRLHDRLSSYTEHANQCLYIPTAYLNCGIKGATGALRHYGAAADLRDALALELL